MYFTHPLFPRNCLAEIFHTEFVSGFDDQILTLQWHQRNENLKLSSIFRSQDQSL